MKTIFFKIFMEISCYTMVQKKKIQRLYMFFKIYPCLAWLFLLGQCAQIEEIHTIQINLPKPGVPIREMDKNVSGVVDLHRTKHQEKVM